MTDSVRLSKRLSLHLRHRPDLYGTAVTVLEYLTDRLRLSPDRAREHLRSGFVRLDGEVVMDGAEEVAGRKVGPLQPPAITAET